MKGDKLELIWKFYESMVSQSMEDGSMGKNYLQSVIDGRKIEVERVREFFRKYAPEREIEDSYQDKWVDYTKV